MALSLAGASAAQAAEPPDPLAAGPFAVERMVYDDGPAVVGSGTIPPRYVVEARGVIHLPVGAPGPRPLIVLLHGRHNTCTFAGRHEIDFVSMPPACPETPASEPRDSYLGYEYLGRNLASHGYVVDSVDANGINSLDVLDGGIQARAELLVATLDRLAAWAVTAGPDPVGARLVGRVDLDRIGLMGHSRGGEGVTAAIPLILDRPTGRRYGLRAVVALAPTDFGDRRPAGVAWATLLPSCDGDVYDLSGAHQYERAAAEGGDAEPVAQWLVRGANHNWFNTVWEEDGDEVATSDRQCHRATPQSLRITAEATRAVGMALIAGFLRRHVGPEPELDAVVAGDASMPAGVCSLVSRVPCRDFVRTSSLPAKDERRTLFPAGAPVESSGPVTALACDSTGIGETAPARPCPGGEGARSWGPQTTLRWSDEAVVSLPLPAEAADVTAFGAMVVRAAGNPDSPAGGPDVDLALVDRHGHAHPFAADHSTALVPLTESGQYNGGLAPDRETPPTAAEPPPHVVLSDIRVPLEAFPVVDLSAVARLELRLHGRGSIQLGAVHLVGHRTWGTPLPGPVEPTGAGPARSPAARPRSGSDDPLRRRAGACAGPPLTVRRLRLGRRLVEVAGGATTVRRCGGSRSVRISITRRIARGRCRTLTATGRMSARMNCARAGGIVVRVAANGLWTLRARAALRPGRYVVEVVSGRARRRATTRVR